MKVQARMGETSAQPRCSRAALHRSGRIDPAGHAVLAPSRSEISVVIPTLMEEACIEQAVTDALAISEDVVVVDGGSTDRTRVVAAEAGARVFVCPSGRGAQLDYGARVAHGSILLFLHADGRLPADAGGAIEHALLDPEVVGGNFRLVFTPASPAATLFSTANHWRRLWLGIYYGDSAIFVRRVVYESLGGFQPIPLFEDYEFVKRLERFGRTSYLRGHVVTASSRRFVRRPWYTLALWTALQVLYSGGIGPGRLLKFYRALR